MRQSGSHKIYKNERDRRITIPYHSGKVLHPKVVKSILRDADIYFCGRTQKIVEEINRRLGEIRIAYVSDAACGAPPHDPASPVRA